MYEATYKSFSQHNETDVSETFFSFGEECLCMNIVLQCSYLSSDRWCCLYISGDSLWLIVRFTYSLLLATELLSINCSHSCLCFTAKPFQLHGSAHRAIEREDNSNCWCFFWCSCTSGNFHDILLLLLDKENEKRNEWQ